MLAKALPMVPPAPAAPVALPNAVDAVPVAVAGDVAAVAEPEVVDAVAVVPANDGRPMENAGDGGANIAEDDGRTAQEGDDSICVICHDTIDQKDQANIHFHWCGHVFHRFCMMDWKQVARLPDVDCPNRCHTLLHNGALNGVLMLDQIIFH